MSNPWRIFWIFLRLGLTSFGGPVAHIGYFRNEFVTRRRWLSEQAYTELVALCQFLPGPASSQVGIALGLSRGGIGGALAAWLGFTLPSAAALVAFACYIGKFADNQYAGWLHGFKLVAVPVVAQAILGMTKSLGADRLRIAITLVAAATALALPTAFGQIAIIISSGLLGILLLQNSAPQPGTAITTNLRRRVGAVALGAFFVLLIGLPIAAAALGSDVLKEFEHFYRAGALVFGGGHVVLPLLQAEIVPPGWVSSELFLAGYGATQAVPGPLFTFAAYLGAVSTVHSSSLAGAVTCLIGIFLPAFLLIIGVLPFWERLRKYRPMQRAVLGINAAAIGILIAAFVTPVCSSALTNISDVAIAIAAFVVLVYWKAPPWIVVALTIGAGNLCL